MAKTGKPFIPDISTMLQVGLNPKTGLPAKMGDPGSTRKSDIKKLFRVVDEQDAINSFQWWGLPNGLTGSELERFLYYRGQLMFFYLPEIDQFYFMPYVVAEGGLDFYGRPNKLTPIPFYEGEEADKKAQQLYLSKIIKTVQKDIKLDEIKYDDIMNGCCIIRDYSPQWNMNTIIPRQQLQEAIIDIESDIPCYLRTSLKNSTGVQGMRVNDQSAYSNVLAANDALDRAAIEGDRLVPIIAQIEMQDLSSGQVLKAEEYLECLQSIDNLRKGFLGLDNGGIFQKKEHVLQAEQQMNAGGIHSTLQDRLYQRQHFCDIANSLFGLNIWCEPTEGAIGADMDMDGTIMEDNSEAPMEETANVE